MKRKWLALGTLSFLSLATCVGVVANWEYLFQSKNYRAYNSFPHQKRLLGRHFSKCSSNLRTPSDKAPFSGGGRVNFTQMKRINDSHPGEVYVVNLREDHGYYYGSKPISYYGMVYKAGTFYYEKSRKRKKQWLFTLRRALAGLPENSKDIDQSQLLTEEQALENRGIHYVKFDLVRQHFASKWEFVDRAIPFFESLPPQAWVHFHCAGGRGRTTTLAILYDIFHNGRKDSVEDILTHHHCLGGENIAFTHIKPHGSWTRQNLEGRLALIQTFHRYMNAPDGYPIKKWTKWLDDHGIPVEFNLT